MRVWWWMDYVLSVTFHILWVLPLFCLSKVINSFWFQVSNSTLRIASYIVNRAVLVLTLE